MGGEDSWGDSGETEGEGEAVGCDRSFVPKIMPNNNPPMIAVAAKNDPKANRAQGGWLSVSGESVEGGEGGVVDKAKCWGPTAMVVAVGTA